MKNDSAEKSLEKGAGRRERGGWEICISFSK